MNSILGRLGETVELGLLGALDRCGVSGFDLCWECQTLVHWVNSDEIRTKASANRIVLIVSAILSVVPESVSRREYSFNLATREKCEQQVRFYCFFFQDKELLHLPDPVCQARIVECVNRLWELYEDI